MNPKFVLVSRPERPLVGTFVYGMVGQHEELVERCRQTLGYVKVHGGGWYEKDDVHRTMTLYGRSYDYGDPDLSFLNCIPAELRDYKFFFIPGWDTRIPGNELDLTGVEWL